MHKCLVEFEFVPLSEPNVLGITARLQLNLGLRFARSGAGP